MLNYHGMKIVLPTDTPESVEEQVKRNPKTIFHAAIFSTYTKQEEDKNGKMVPVIVKCENQGPNRRQRRYSERMHMRKRNNGIPVGYSSLEWGRATSGKSDKNKSE